MRWKAWLEAAPRPFLLLGMVHLPPLPGSPRWGGSMAPVLEAARRDAGALLEGGMDGVVVENFGDAPFLPGPVPPETVAAMTAAVAAVGEVAAGRGILGVNMLRNDARSALAVAAVTGAALIRVNVHTGAMWTDQGLVQGRAWETLRERSRLGAGVAVAADVLVKHGEPPVPVDPSRAAREAVERGLADAVIVTGPGTGEPLDLAALEAVRGAVEVPVLAGSGVTPEALPRLARLADGAIVGTWLKSGGRVTAPVDPQRVRKLTAARDALEE